MDVVERKGLMLMDQAWSDFLPPYNDRNIKHD